MSFDVFLALAIFCFVSTITPGPNNMMLISSGATFGFRRTVPHMIGISLGCAAMVLLLGFGLAGTIARLPWLYSLLHIASIAYLLYLAWRIAMSTGAGAVSDRARPLGFWGAAAFQWVNPKAWAMALGAVTSFARPDQLTTDIPIVTLIFVVVGLPCIALWAAGGLMIRPLLARPKTLRAFNITMAALLVASLIPGIIEAF